MKKAIGFLAAVLILATIVNVAGCSSGTKEVAPGKERAVSLMQMLPANTSDFSCRHGAKPHLDTPLLL